MYRADPRGKEIIMAVIYGTNNPDYIDTYPSTSNDTLYKTPLKELTRSRKFQQPALANLWKSIGKSFLRKRMAWL